MEIRELSRTSFESKARAMGFVLPIEQTLAWADYQDTIDGRKHWGFIEAVKGEEVLALASIIDYKTHGYHYLRIMHGPIWLESPSVEQESAFVEAFVSFVRKKDKRQVFVRMAVASDLDSCLPTLSTLPYDSTVVIDLEGGEEEILSRMKTRGRRDVRKALRESPATYADETELAAKDFSEYYDVMVETAQRDGFSPSPQSDYENMMQILGPERCRVFAGRVDGHVVTWTIATVSDGHAVRYYGASRSDVPNRNYVTDGLIFFEAVTFGAEGVLDYDMMGIGSECFPGLDTLNTFKCKFSKEIVMVAPDRDVPFKPLIYAGIAKAREILRGSKETKGKEDYGKAQ